jgi:hypothetical protein
MKSNDLKIFLQFLVTILVFLSCYRLGRNQNNESDNCLHHVYKAKISSQSFENASLHPPLRPHYIHYNDKNPVMTTIFHMLHHPNTPSTAEFVIGNITDTENSEGKENLSFGDNDLIYRLRIQQISIKLK